MVEPTGSGNSRAVFDFAATLALRLSGLTWAAVRKTRLVDVHDDLISICRGVTVD